MQKKVLPLLIFMITMLLTACGGDNGNNTKTRLDFSGFQTVDIAGQPVTDSVFAENELTLVNIMATWCGPCGTEMPHLEALAKETEGLGVVGIVTDTVDRQTGEQNAEGISTARELKALTGVTYPLLIPDQTLIDLGVLRVSSFPTSFFVDKTGRQVGQTYAGARSLEGWQAVLAEVRE